ncbi:MAG: hypothetical protein JW384_02124 [Nitrosomonadaceae bacterium]|nr:hypothetical protein [Nitrosomonadaceae bacterium]
MPPAPNTGLPAPVATLLPPNPCAVMPFAEKQGRKRPALTAGSATRGRYVKAGKTKSKAPWFQQFCS